MSVPGSCWGLAAGVFFGGLSGLKTPAGTRIPATLDDGPLSLQHSTPAGVQWPLISKIVLALLALNFLVSFGNIWPTALVQPQARIAPELVALWLILLLAVALFGRIGRRTLTLLSGVFLLLVIGHYTDTTVQALLGRPLNLYWDGHQLPTFLSVVSQALSGWQIVGFIVALVIGLRLLYCLIHSSINLLAEHAAPRVVRSPLALLATAASAGLVLAGLLQVAPLSSLVSRPVIPLYAQQADLLLNAFVPGRRARALPPSPSLASDLRLLDGAEVKVLFLESYGATTYDQRHIANSVDVPRARFARAARQQGRHVLTAFVRAATFGGASDLSHLSLLSGIDLSDPLRHNILLTTDRPTILDTFEHAGYRTIGLYPSMSWEWPERSFYSFDHYLDGPSLDYRGPAFGLWWVPDQFAMARVDEMFPPDPDGKPRFLFYPTIASHIPFRPTPPYQADWQRITSDQPFADEAAAAALAAGLGWNDLASAYVRSIEYTFDWLAGYQSLPQARESVMVLLGDHQPASSVSGPDANWDVPVHVITANDTIAERLRQQGFTDVVNARRPAFGHISDLSRVLLAAFDSGAGEVDIAAGTSPLPGMRGAAL